MIEQEIIKKVMKKREFSMLPLIDVLLAFSHFKKRQVSDIEKIRLTRELLHKAFGAFCSKKLFSFKSKSFDWFLRKHLSTRERISFYPSLYEKILDDEDIIFDLGSGVNGFSYKFFNRSPKYIAIDSVGQLVDLVNTYFENEKFNAKAIWMSLFELQKLKSIIKKEKGIKIVFLFKTFDSLEMIKRNYSKKLLLEIVPLVDKVVISFATKSMVSRKKFKSKRKWILRFIKENFEVLNDFIICSERFIVFRK